MANGLFNFNQVNQAIQQGGWPNQKTPSVEFLVVAGGGGGAGTTQSYGCGGGGGAGGLITGLLPVANNTTYLVTVGGGGAGGSSNAANAVAGQNSVFGQITAVGGGFGAGYPGSGAGSGGSGGGTCPTNAGYAVNGGQGIIGQGNDGGAVATGATVYQGGGGGGGGAQTVGLRGNANSARGGSGVASAISGTVTAYAGGGGGGSGTAADGGAGGGGQSYATGGGAGQNGFSNTGGGGGGGSYGPVTAGGTGGSGIVIVSYPDIYAAATTSGGTASTSGSGSISFNGTNQGIIYTDNAGLSLGTSDFTVECFVYPGSQASGNSTVIGGEANGAFQITLTSATGTPTGVAINAYGTSPFFSQSYAFSQNVWYHIACTRSGTSVRVYVNGVQLGSTTSDSTNYSAGTRSIGEIAGGTAQRYAGNVSNVRIVKGTALYTGATLTVPTAPLSAVSGTSLLLNAVSGSFTADASSNSLAPSTSYGTPAWSSVSPFTVTGYKNRVYTFTGSGTITF